MLRRTDFKSLAHYILFIKSLLTYISSVKNCVFVPADTSSDEIGIFEKDGFKYQFFVSNDDYDNLEFHYIKNIDAYTQERITDSISAFEEYISIVIWNCFFTNTLQKL